MTVYFCPKCGNAGEKAERNDCCTKCLAVRRIEHSRKHRERMRAQPGSSEAEKSAMKGFSPLSQDYLMRKL